MSIMTSFNDKVKILFECSISYEKIKIPFISPSGYLFEFNNIQKWIRINNKCPFTRNNLSDNQLINLRKLLKLYNFNNYELKLSLLLSDRMENPVISPSGNIYEYSIIKEWLKLYGNEPFMKYSTNIKEFIPFRALQIFYNSFSDDEWDELKKDIIINNKIISFEYIYNGLLNNIIKFLNSAKNQIPYINEIIYDLSLQDFINNLHENYKLKEKIMSNSIVYDLWTTFTKNLVYDIYDLSQCNNITNNGINYLLKLTNLKVLKLYDCNMITNNGLLSLSKFCNLNIYDYSIQNILNLLMVKNNFDLSICYNIIVFCIGDKKYLF